MKLIQWSKNYIMDSYLVLRSGVGRGIREAGLELDRRGSQAMDDIAYLEPLNRHRNILPLFAQHPIIAQSTYVAPNCTIIGDVFVGRNSYFGFGSVAHGSSNAVRVGANTKIGDNTVLDTAFFIPEEAFSPSLNIGMPILIDVREQCKYRTLLQPAFMLCR